MSRLGRTLFVIFAATAVALVVGSTACTRRGGNGAPPVTTPTPISAYYVNPVKGNDANNGSSSAPFKTIGRALKAVKSATTAAGLTISLSAGVYDAHSGEVFPIVVPTGVTITGTSYGRALTKGTYINGTGEDTTLEKSLGKPSSHTLYATLVVPSGVSLTFDQIYIGTTIPPRSGTYSSVDVMGSMSASSDAFGIAGKGAANGGIVVPSGTLSCIACYVIARDFAIKAFSLSGSGSGPQVTLSGPGHSVIGGADGIRTDGTATITASTQVFQSRNNAYTDSLAAPTTAPSGKPSASPTGSSYYGGGSVDFGYGAQNSIGGNTFVGSATEIDVTLGDEQIVARGNSWNVIARGPQKTNRSGQYPRPLDFHPGADGMNVKIAGSAAGSEVSVGPPKPTPTPSPSPYYTGSPTASPSASPT